MLLTVKELIAKLQRHPSDAIVVFYDHQFDELVDITTVELSRATSRNTKEVSILSNKSLVYSEYKIIKKWKRKKRLNNQQM